jgi:hypothetical protein
MNTIEHTPTRGISEISLTHQSRIVASLEAHGKPETGKSAVIKKIVPRSEQLKFDQNAAESIPYQRLENQVE